jgi:hypothetical protein
MNNENLKPFKKGDPRINRKGRPKGMSLKSYMAKKLFDMTPEEKEKFLKDTNPELRWRMAEGNPQSDLTSDGEKLPTPIYVLPGNDSNQEDIPTEETD